MVSRIKKASFDRRIVAAIWILNVSFITANVCIYLYAANIVFRSTGSHFLGSAVFAFQWSLPIIFAQAIHWANLHHSPRTVLVGVSMACLALLPVVATAGHTLAVPFVLSALYGFLESQMKVTRLIALKCYVSAGALKKAVALSATGQAIGGAIGGLCFAMFPENWFALGFAGAVSPLYVVACIAAMRLPRRSAQAVEQGVGAVTIARLPSCFGFITRDNPALARSLVGVLLASRLFQGFHNVVRVDLPIETWSATSQQIGILQSIVAGASLLSSWVYSQYMSWMSRLWFSLISTVSCIILMVSSTFVENFAEGSILYGGFIFFYGILFMKYQTESVALVRSEDIGLMAVMQYAAINLGMMLSIMLGGMAADALGLKWTAFVFAAIYLIFIWIVTMVTWEYRLNPHRGRERQH